MKDWFDNATSKKGNATLLSDASESSQKPTRANILAALKEKAGKECGRLIVTFAGHGVYYGGRSFFCPIDVKGLDFDAVAEESRAAVVAKGQECNLIAVEEALNILKGAKAKEVVVIFDACRNGDDGKDNFVREFQEMLAPKSADAQATDAFQRTNGGFFVLTSCATGEEALEMTVGDKTHGAFTYYLVDGLKGKADVAGCCDGYVALNEAYNYAQCRVGEYAVKRGKRQSPELMMATEQMKNLPTMSRVSLEELFGGASDLAEVDQWSDEKFLLRAGWALSGSKKQEETLRLGEKTLNCVLEFAPNNKMALELRGSVRRTLGDWQGAINDWERVGAKMQVYVKSTRNETGWPDGACYPEKPEHWRERALLPAPGENETDEAETVRTYDLLTITEIRDGWAYVTEKNNAPLAKEKAGWIKTDDLVWDFNIAKNIVNASKLQGTRHSGSGHGASLEPGNRPLGARPNNLANPAIRN